MAVVADKRGPKQYEIDNPLVFYLSIDIQVQMASLSPMVEAIPWNHFGRKNVGYLWAIVHGAQVIWDFDDDNELLAPLVPWRPNSLVNNTIFFPNYNESVMNVYPYLGASNNKSWPRGFPLLQLKVEASNPTPSNTKALLGSWNSSKIGIVQSLANHDPDVDAIYRITQTLPLNFDRSDTTRTLILPKRTMSPYNAQATLHYHNALWTLMLPISVHGRVADILRSYIMQRLLWDAGIQIAFDGPWVRQERNVHNYLADFDSEQPLYLRTEKLVEFLLSWKSSKATLPERIIDLYVEMYERGYIDAVDVDLIQYWLAELLNSGYIFPTIASRTTLIVRTYGHDIKRLNEYLLPTLDMFVNKKDFDFTIVLDNENAHDHLIGTCLVQNGYNVVYEDLPLDHEKIFRGTAFGGSYGRPGYDRQQWWTFYLDQHTDADLIGVMDADSMVYAYLARSSIYDQDARILLRAATGDHYQNDPLALKSTRTASQFLDFMWTDRNPFWLRRETFQNVRNYISNEWEKSFDEAFVAFSDKSYSQFNIIFNYAVVEESNFYRAILPNDSTGVVSVGCNRCRPEDVPIGCCRSFGVECENLQHEWRGNIDHLLRFNNYDVSWIGRGDMVDAYYSEVQKELGEIDPDLVDEMKQSCEAYIKGQVRHGALCVEL